jgi:hypothetical protein
VPHKDRCGSIPYHGTASKAPNPRLSIPCSRFEEQWKNSEYRASVDSRKGQWSFLKAIRDLQLTVPVQTSLNGQKVHPDTTEADRNARRSNAIPMRERENRFGEESMQQRNSEATAERKSDAIEKISFSKPQMNGEPHTQGRTQRKRFLTLASLENEGRKWPRESDGGLLASHRAGGAGDRSRSARPRECGPRRRSGQRGRFGTARQTREQRTPHPRLCSDAKSAAESPPRPCAAGPPHRPAISAPLLEAGAPL